MAKKDVLIEVVQQLPEAFTFHAAVIDSETDRVRTAEEYVTDLAGY